ncbi:unnamed protein product [Soboliphyme baturini]|uniref:Nucleolar protein 6 n=1 Tax=Soboliphyme baturini TaxID=241478 RepID=A0A183IRE3_9BILA|nr:unnamed protein product [Soboliphyme baturini]
MDCGAFERLFAQKLSSADSNIRRRALKHLQEWIQEQCKIGHFLNRSSFVNLWQGLYYCFWMQDKPLMQEELADKIGGLGAYFSPVKQQLLFYDVFFKQIGLEWYSIDRWRMNKFMMLVRRIFRSMLIQLKQSNWKKKVISKVFNMMSKTVLSSESIGYPSGLKLHFASIYLDELDFVGAVQLHNDQTMFFLLPYINLLKSSIE